MSEDTLGASALFGTPTVGGSAAPAALATSAPAATSPDQAASAIEALKSNPEFVRRYLAGDAGARKEMNDLHAIASRPAGVVISGDPPAHSERTIDAISEFASLTPEIEQQMRSGQPVSASEYRQAVNRRTQLLSDRSWTEKYLAGDQRARQEMTLVSIILSSKLALQK